MADQPPGFRIAIICALPLEYDAVTLAFNELWSEAGVPQGTLPKGYSKCKTGHIGGQNIILLLMSSMEIISAAAATIALRLTHPQIELAVLAGICGGVPSPGSDNEILLGDVIISKKLVERDLSRPHLHVYTKEDTTQDFAGQPNKMIGSLLAIFSTKLGRRDLQNRTTTILGELQWPNRRLRIRHTPNGMTTEKIIREIYTRPAAEDTLFESDYLHRHRNSSSCGCGKATVCDIANRTSCKELECDVGRQVSRRRLESRKRQEEPGKGETITHTSGPWIHIGSMVSGDTVITTGEYRDQIAREHGIIAFEFGSTRICGVIPSILVKGVCDYADSHKNNEWQNFAAAAAASATKALLEYYTQADRSTITTTQTWFIVPFLSNPGFVGRSEVLKHIGQLFGHAQPREQAIQTCSRVVLWGASGIGKTQIALAYVYWLHYTRNSVSVFWVSAGSQEQFRQSYHSIAQKCGIPGYDDPNVEVLSLVKNWLERANRGRSRWLMVVDNADNIKLFSPEKSELTQHAAGPSEMLARYLPDCHHGSILFTTTSDQAEIQPIEGTQPLQVLGMIESEALQLIQSITGEKVTAAESELVAERVGYLPLAIAQIAILARKKDISIGKLLRLLGVIDDSEANLKRDHGVSPSTAELEEILDLRREIHGRAHHDTVKSMTELAAAYYAQGRYKDHEKITREVLELRQKMLGQTHPDTIQSMTELAAVCYAQGRYKEHENITIEVLALRKEILGLAHPDTIQSMTELAAAYNVQKRYKEQEVIETELLKLRREILDHRQPDEIDETDTLRFTDITQDQEQTEIPEVFWVSGRSIIESDGTSGRSSPWSSVRLVSTKPSSLEENTNAGNDDVAKQKIENFFRHTDIPYHQNEDEDEIKSMVSGPEDIQSQDGSGSVRWEVRTAAVSYLAELLINDPNLVPLYVDAAKRLQDDRFFRNHERLLKKYYLSLRSQAPNQKQKVAIEFLRPRIHRRLISLSVHEKILSYDKDSRSKVNATLPEDDKRNLTLELFLNGVEAFSKSLPTENSGMAPYYDEEESSSDEEDRESIKTLVDLEETRSFFISGAPLAHFEAEFRSFLYPIREEVEETPELEILKPLERTNLMHWRVKLSSWLYDLWFPPKPGYERVRYTCACGDDMFLDARELSPGGMTRFLERLANDGLAHLTAAQDSDHYPNGLSLLPPAHLRPEGSSSSASGQSSDFETSSFRTRSFSSTTNTSWSEEQTSEEEEESSLQYLLVCINQKSLPVLVPIECSSFENDQYLFQQILEEYRMIRERSTWKTSFLLPSSASTVFNRASEYLAQRIPSWMEWIPRLFQSLSEISLFKMDTGDFVRFQLVPVGEATVPNNFKCAEFPPESEVKAGNYLYEPVPMFDVELASIPLWHLTRPGQHSDKYWITTFPKKLRYPLHREAGVYVKPTIGWGIRVNEALNLHHFLFLILVVIVFIGVIMGIYLACTADDSSAFGLAAFLAAASAIYIPYQYFAWKEKLE